MIAVSELLWGKRKYTGTLTVPLRVQGREIEAETVYPGKLIEDMQIGCQRTEQPSPR